MELVGDRLTFREDVTQVLCAKNIPDDDNNDCGNDDDVTKVVCSCAHFIFSDGDIKED